MHQTPDLVFIEFDLPYAECVLPIPRFNRGILSSADENIFSPRNDTNSEHRLSVPSECVLAEAGRYFPDFNGGVIASGDEMFLVLKKC